MAKSKKKLSGEGWSFTPASEQNKPAAVESLPPGEQTIRLRKEKRNKGKVMTVAQGFVLSAKDLKALAKKLKAKAGGGGSCADDSIEVQGEHFELVAEFLRAAGYQVKGA
jgi:translation initiation factor 1